MPECFKNSTSLYGPPVAAAGLNGTFKSNWLEVYQTNSDLFTYNHTVDKVQVCETTIGNSSSRVISGVQIFMAAPYNGTFRDEFALQPIGNILETGNPQCKNISLRTDEFIKNITLEWSEPGINKIEFFTNTSRFISVGLHSSQRMHSHNFTNFTFEKDNILVGF